MPFRRRVKHGYYSSTRSFQQIVSFWGTMEYIQNNGVYTFELKPILSTGNTSEWDLEVYSCEKKNLDPGPMLRRLSPDFVIAVSYTGEKNTPVELNFTFKNYHKEIIRSEKEIKTDFGVSETRLSKFYKKSEFSYSPLHFEVVVRNFQQDSIPSPSASVLSVVGGVPQKMLALLNSKMHSDFVIRVGDTDIPVHKCILGSSSTVFEALLRSEMSEAACGRVQINNLNLNTVRTMVNFMYAGIVYHPTVTLALDLLRASDFYALNDLQVWCFQYLEQQLDTNNILEILLFAHDFNNPKLKEKCLNFLCTNKHRVDFSRDLKKGLKERSDLAMELLEKVWK